MCIEWRKKGKMKISEYSDKRKKKMKWIKFTWKIHELYFKFWKKCVIIGTCLTQISRGEVRV